MTHVTETHIHADFVSGSRELAARTGATAVPVGRGRRRLEVRVRGRGRRDAAQARRSDHGRQRRFDVAAHAGAHARAPLVPRHRRRGRERADRRRDRRLHLRRRRRPSRSARARRATSTGTMEVGARDAVSSLAAVPRPAGLAADLARPRRRLGLRQGHQRDSAQHARLRTALQLGVPVASEKPTSSRAVLAGQPDPPTYFAEMKRVNKDGPRDAGRLARGRELFAG